MKRFGSNGFWHKLALSGGLLILVVCDVALAADGERNWRPIYDQVMDWINFAILFFLVYKFGRRPIMEFLKGQKDDIVQEFVKLEERKNNTLASVQEAMDALEKSKLRLPGLKARIIEQGERKRQELIEEAQEQSRSIMEGARHKIDYQILRAREELSLELLDMAVEEALKELPQVFTPEDDQRQIERYLVAAHSK